MCRSHWFRVPKALRDRVWATYRAGQCDDMSPSAAYCETAKAAVIAVASKDGLLPDTALYDLFLARVGGTWMGDQSAIEWTSGRMPRYLGQSGAKNGAWKGGRSIASSGYVLVRLPGHYLADVRGYVYEHRLVAEQILGRRLKPGEIPHHKNGIKTDNRPENIAVLPSRAHRVNEHATRTDRRKADEPNPLTSCACGCMMVFPLYDTSGRPRRFISGHNMGMR